MLAFFYGYKKMTNSQFIQAESYRLAGNYQQANLSYQRYLNENPQSIDGWYGCCLSLQAQGYYLEAISSYRHLLTLEPEYAPAWNNLGLLYTQCFRFKEAKMAYLSSLKLNNLPGVYNNIAQLYFLQGRLEEALREQQHCLSLCQGMSSKEYAQFHSNFLFMLRAMPDLSDKKRFEMFCEWPEKHTLNTQSLYCKPYSPKTPIKIAYLSPDLKKHSVSVIFQPLFEYHNRSQFNLVVYADHLHDDQRTHFFKKYSDDWFSSVHWSDEELTQHILQNQIDILVDLTGHSSGNRLRVFNQRLAPVQVTGLGLCCTTGLNVIDYLLTDQVVIPSSLARFNREKVFYIPSFLYWSPPKEMTQTNPPPVTKNGYITFGWVSLLLLLMGEREQLQAY